MSIQKKQEGFVLITCLILLATMMLIAATTHNMNTTEHLIQYNIKIKDAMEYASMQAIEQTINNSEKFENPTSQTLIINGYTVNVSAPVCLGSKVSSGYSARSSLAPEETLWKFNVDVSDVNSGARIKMSQGVKIKMLAGRCV